MNRCGGRSIWMEEDTQDLLLFTKEEEEFMVVPTLLDSPIPLEDLMSEETFNGLMVDTLQNPSVVFVVDVDRTSSNHNSIVTNNDMFTNCANNFGDGFNYGQYNNSQQVQYQYYQPQFSYNTSDNDKTSLAVSQIQNIQQSMAVQQPQTYSELADPTANWVAQNTDVTLLERFVSESERFRSVDEILDFVPVNTESTYSYNDFVPDQSQIDKSPILDKKQILEEIYREAEEISSKRDSPALWSPSVINDQSNHGSSIGSISDDFVCERTNLSNSSASIDCDRSMDSYHPSINNAKSKKSKSLIDLSTNLKIVIKKSTLAISGLGDQSIAQSIPPKREAAKQKKRHQNREAALRYRLKKRAEREQTNGELNLLLQKNQELKTQKSNISAEIAYLKGLLSEVNKKKQIFMA